jgi:hypothetical protein
LDTTNRHGNGEDVTVDTYPRSYTEYATPDHPGGPETYLVRISVDRRSFFYLLNSDGSVVEHFMTTGADLTLLPLPNLLGADVPHQPRQPWHFDRIRFKVPMS